MKRILTSLTLVAVSLVVSPRQSDAQQYAWVPVISNEPVATTPQSPTAYSASIGEDYATYVGDLPTPEVPGAPGDPGDTSGYWEPSGGKGGKGGKGGCDCPACIGQGFRHRAFGGVEYLQWYNKGRRLPALISTGPVPPERVLFGNEDVGDDLKSGVRFTAGLWLDDCKTSAVVWRGYGTNGDRTTYNGIGPAGGAFLASPFFDLFNNQPGALAVDVGGDAGTITAQASNEILGGDIYYRTIVDQGCDYRLDVLGGYQMTRIDDDLVLSVASNNPFDTNDYFNVSNEYHAFEFGLLGELYAGCTTVQLMGKCGVGNMRQTVGIAGNSSLANNPTDGGLFARPSNIGLYSRDIAVWSPEASVKLIHNVRENISVTVGYTLLYWTRVALAGDQVDTNVNSQALFNGSGTDGTVFAFRDTDFWVQTIDIGLTVAY